METDAGDNLKELWDEYRTGKCWPCSSELLQNLLYAKPRERLWRQYDLGEQRLSNEPHPGSLYWLVTIDPPAWFRKYLSQDHVYFALSHAKHYSRRQRKIMKRLKYRLSHGQSL